MPPDIAALGHRYIVLTDPFEHQAFFYRWRLAQCLVHGFLQGQDLTAAMQPIGSDHQFGASIIIPVGNRLSAETCKDHRVHSSDSGARQHRNGQFGGHRHVDADHVSLNDSKFLQAGSALGDFGAKIRVS